MFQHRIPRKGWQEAVTGVQEGHLSDLLFTPTVKRELQDQRVHCLSPLMGSTVLKVNCPNLLVRGVSDLEAGGTLKTKSDNLSSV